MSEISYEEFIQLNPLYVHNKLEPLNNDIHIIRSKVKLNKQVFANAILSLRNEETKIYKTLGNGDIEQGKNLLFQIANESYYNNNARKNIIEKTKKMFGSITKKSKNYINFMEKISKNGVIDPHRKDIEARILAKKGIDIDEHIEKLKSKNLELKATFGVKKDKKTGAILSRSLNVTRGSTRISKEKEIQELATEYCNNLSMTLSQFEIIRDEILELTKEKGLTKENNSIKKLGQYFNELSKELSIASIDGKVDISLLSDRFYELMSKKGSYFGNIIGIFTEYCDLKVSSDILNQLNELNLTFDPKRGDDIPRILTGSSTNSKADEVIVIKGTIDYPEEMVTIPISLKFRSDSIYKAHSGTILSISELIKKEGQMGMLYSHYFKYLLINAPYWQYERMDNFSDIIMKILNNYAYTFISGGLQQNNLSKAIFINGTFLEDNEYNNYFLPVSKLLWEIYKALLNGDEVLNWTALNNDNDSALKIQKYIESVEFVSDIKSMLRTTQEERKKGNYNYEEFSDNALIIWQNEVILEKISNIIGSTDITFNHKIITNMFNSKGGVLL